MVAVGNVQVAKYQLVVAGVHKMVLGIDKVLELVKNKNLVENLSEKEPEGVELELRVGEVYMLNESEEYSLHIRKRNLPKEILLARYEGKEGTFVKLEPETYYLFKTIESLNTPENIFPLLAPRTTLQRSGIRLFYSTTSPGYKGPLVVGAYNFNKRPFELELGAHILKISFHEVDGTSKLYNGQWQGGRISTFGKEEKQTGFKK